MKFSLLLACALCWFAQLFVSAQQLTVRAKSEQAPEMGTLNYLELEYEQERFSLVPPLGARREMVGESTLRFSQSTGAVTVAVQFFHGSASEILATSDSLRRHAVPDLADANLLEEFPVHGGDMHGKGIDLSFAHHGRAMRCRAAVLPLTHGYVTFVLLCGVDEWKAGQQVLRGISGSFQHARAASAAKETVRVSR